MAAPSRLAFITAFAALYVIWGSTYLGIRIAIETIPPFLMAGTRYFIAGLIMYGIARAQGAPRTSLAQWRSALIIGACLLLGGNGGVTISEKYVETGIAAVMVATVPIYMTLLGWLTGTAPRPTPTVWLGLIGGFAGVFVLVLPEMRLNGSSRHAATGMLILLVGSFIWSAGSLYSRRANNPRSPFLGAAQQMICGGGLLMLTGVLANELRRFDVRQVTWPSIFAWIYLVLIGAIIGFGAYIWLLRNCDPAKVATYAFVNPIVAVILGALFNHETITPRVLVAGTLIIGSVALVILADQIKIRSAPPAAAAVAEPD